MLADILSHSLTGLFNLEFIHYVNSGLKVIIYWHKFKFEILNGFNNNTTDSKELILNVFINLTKLMIRKYITVYNINGIKILFNMPNTKSKSYINALSYNIVLSPTNLKNCVASCIYE